MNQHYREFKHKAVTFCTLHFTKVTVQKGQVKVTLTLMPSDTVLIILNPNPTSTTHSHINQTPLPTHTTATHTHAQAHKHTAHVLIYCTQVIRRRTAHVLWYFHPKKIQPQALHVCIMQTVVDSFRVCEHKCLPATVSVCQCFTHKLVHILCAIYFFRPWGGYTKTTKMSWQKVQNHFRRQVKQPAN